jgi:hypothetical protein
MQSLFSLAREKTLRKSPGLPLAHARKGCAKAHRAAASCHGFGWGGGLWSQGREKQSFFSSRSPLFLRARVRPLRKSPLTPPLRHRLAAGVVGFRPGAGSNNPFSTVLLARV